MNNDRFDINQFNNVLKITLSEKMMDMKVL